MFGVVGLMYIIGLKVYMYVLLLIINKFNYIYYFIWLVMNDVFNLKDGELCKVGVVMIDLLIGLYVYGVIMVVIL